MSSAPENAPNVTDEQTGAVENPASPVENSGIEQQIATKLEQLEEMDRDIEQLNAITSEISQSVAAGTGESDNVQSVSQQVSLLEPQLSSIQNSIFEHQVELRSELHAMRAEFGKLQQKQEKEMFKLEKVNERLEEKMNTLGLSQKTQLGLKAIIGVALVAMVGWAGSSLVSSVRRAIDGADPNSPEAFVMDHLNDIRDGRLQEAWNQADENFKQQAAQGEFEAYEEWWTDVAYPIPDTAVTNVTQVKLYTEWSYCNRETKQILENVGFWYLSKVPGNEWRLDRIEIPPDLPARQVGDC